jgi:hypothetical protein
MRTRIRTHKDNVCLPSFRHFLIIFVYMVKKWSEPSKKLDWRSFSQSGLRRVIRVLCTTSLSELKGRKSMGSGQHLYCRSSPPLPQLLSCLRESLELETFYSRSSRVKKVIRVEEGGRPRVEKVRQTSTAVRGHPELGIQYSTA